MSALGVDPAPGDPEAVSALAARWSDVATELVDTAALLSRAVEPGAGWTGEAARAFGADGGELLAQLRATAEAVAAGAGALRAWAASLQERQERARRLEGRAQDALSALSRAQAESALAQQALWDGGGALPLELSRAAVAARVLDAAQDELDRLRAAGAALRAEHEDDARRYARALHEAAALAPRPPSLLARAWHGASGAVQDHANVLAELGDVAAEGSGLLGVAVVPLALAAPPAALVVGTAALALAGGGAALHALGAAGGAEVSGTTFALDAVGVASAGVGNLAARALARPLEAAAPAAGAAAARLAGRTADAAGTTAVVTGTATQWDGGSDDGPFQHFVADDRLEREVLAAGGPLLGLPALAATSAVRHGREKDARRACRP